MKEYARMSSPVSERRLKKLDPYVQEIVGAVRSVGIDVFEAHAYHRDRFYTSKLLLYFDAFLVTVHHTQHVRRRCSMVELNNTRVRNFAFSVFLQDVPKFPKQIFYIPQAPLLRYLRGRAKHQMYLPLRGEAMTVKDMPLGFSWADFEGDRGLQKIKDLIALLKARQA